VLPHFLEIPLLNKFDILCRFAFAFAPTASQSSLSFRFGLTVSHYSLQLSGGDAVRDGRNFTQKYCRDRIEVVIVWPQKFYRLMIGSEKSSDFIVWTQK
jgi:hypothetical protein